MCNLYNITTSQEAIRQWTRALRDIAGNLEPSIDIYPNQPAGHTSMRIRPVPGPSSRQPCSILSKVLQRRVAQILFAAHVLHPSNKTRPHPLGCRPFHSFRRRP